MNEKIDLRPKILEIIQKDGPVIPRDIVKEVGGDTFIIGAVLMQLKDSGKILVTNTKVGGTPAYYCEGQEEKLQTLEKYLNEKDRYSYHLLKENKILRDYDQPTHVRMSLRQIKDFAIPLVVSVNDEDEIFWKWYTTPIEEAEDIIKEIMPTIPKKEEEIVPEITNKEEIPEQVQEVIKKDEVIEQKQEEPIESEQKDEIQTKIVEEIKEINNDKTEQVSVIKKVKNEKIKKPSKERKKAEEKIKEAPKKNKSAKKEKKIKSKNNNPKKPIKQKAKKGFFKRILSFFR